jgi:hypothetical protein
MPNPVATFRRNKAKVWAFCVGMAVFSLLCLAIALDMFPVDNIDTFARGLLLAGFLLFGFLAFVWSKQLFDNAAILEVSDEGIRDTRYSSVLIPWSVIDNVRLTETQYGEFLTLGLQAATQAKIPRAWYLKAFDVGNAALGYRGVQISVTGLNGTMSDLAAAIKAAAPERLKNFA